MCGSLANPLRAEQLGGLMEISCDVKIERKSSSGDFYRLLWNSTLALSCTDRRTFLDRLGLKRRLEFWRQINFSLENTIFSPWPPKSRLVAKGRPPDIHHKCPFTVPAQTTPRIKLSNLHYCVHSNQLLISWEESFLRDSGSVELGTMRRFTEFTHTLLLSSRARRVFVNGVLQINEIKHPTLRLYLLLMI